MTPHCSIRPKKWFSLVALVILGAGIVGNSHAQGNWIDLIRTEPGEFSLDVVYQLHNRQWQEPVVLTRGSRTDEFAPATLRVDNRRALAVWKELTGVDASALLYCFINFDTDGNVSSVGEIRTLKTITAHQSSPTLIRDLQGRIWGFWVGLNGKDDDIYFAELIDNAWSEEKRLFENDNDVPDLRPTARLNVAGIVELRWRQFSFEKGAYIDVFSTIKHGEDGEAHWSPPQEYLPNPLEKIPRLPEDFTLPEGVSSPDSIAINYFGNPDIVIHWDKLSRENGSANTGSGDAE